MNETNERGDLSDRVAKLEAEVASLAREVGRFRGSGPWHPAVASLGEAKRRSVAAHAQSGRLRGRPGGRG